MTNAELQALYEQQLLSQPLTLEQLSQMGFFAGNGTPLGAAYGSNQVANLRGVLENPNALVPLSFLGEGDTQRYDTAANALGYDPTTRSLGFMTDAGDIGNGAGAYGRYTYSGTVNPDGTVSLANPQFQQQERSEGWLSDNAMTLAALAAAGITGAGALGYLGSGSATAAGLGVGAGGTADGAALAAGGLGTGAGTSAGLLAAENGILGSTVGANSAYTAPGWVSAEGGAGYLNGLAADAGALGYSDAAMAQILNGLPASGADPAGLAALESGASAAGGIKPAVDAAKTGSTLMDLLNTRAGAAAVGAGLGALAGSEDSTKTQTSTIDPMMRQYLQDYISRAQQVADTPFQSYTGQLTAGLTDAQRSAGAAYQNTVDQLPQTQAQIQGLLGAGTAANPYATADNPYLQSAIDAANQATVRNYNTVAAPKYAQGSSFGNSGLAQYENADRANLLQQLGNNATNMSYQGYQLAGQLTEQGAQRNLTGANTAMQAAQLPNQLAQGLLGYGTLEQQTNQAFNDAAYQQFLREINYPTQQLGVFGGALGQQAGSTTTQTTPGNALSGGIGGAILGAQISNWLNGTGNTNGSTTQKQWWQS